MAVPARLELGGAFLTTRGFVDDDLGGTRAIDPPPLVGKDLTVISDADLPQPQFVDGRSFNIAAALVWIGGTAWLLVAHPARPLTALVLSIGGGLWLLVVGVLRSVQGQDRQFSEAPADVSEGAAVTSSEEDGEDSGAAAVTSSAEASDRP